MASRGDPRVTPIPEPERDARLARAVREAEGGGTSPARLELLRSRIAMAASAVLENRREREWWEWMTRWARTEVALAAAATILAAVLGGAAGLGRVEMIGDTIAASSAVATTEGRSPAVDSIVAHAVATGASSEQVMNALVGPATGDWLLTETVAR